MIAWITLALGCEPPPVAARAVEARRRFLNDDYAVALTVSEDTLGALGCADALVTAADLTSLHQTAVAAAAEVRAEDRARSWAEAAARLLPEAEWPLDVLGARGAAYWDAARAAPPSPVRLRTRAPLWVDGRPAAQGATLELRSGVHLVQEMAADGSIQTTWLDVADAVVLGRAPEPAAHTAARPWLLGGGATLAVAGMVGMFVGSEDLFCAGQLLPNRVDASCQTLTIAHEQATRQDYDRISDRGLALRATGMVAASLGVATLAIGWAF